MTTAELDQAAGKLLAEAIAAGRLPESPDPAVLVNIAAVIRPALEAQQPAAGGA